MNYKVNIPVDMVGAKKPKYIYRYTPAKKLDDKRTAMAGVEVFNLEGVKIGGQCFTREPKNQFTREVKQMVNYIIYDYENSL